MPLFPLCTDLSHMGRGQNRFKGSIWPFQRFQAKWATPAMQETWEDPLENEMATLSSILIWEIPWTEEPGGLQTMRSQRVEHDLVTEHAHKPNTL